MDELKNTLPGDIPELLQDGAILRYEGRRAVAVQANDGFVLIAHHASGADEETEVEGGTVTVGYVVLDLTDATGRWHAAMWATAHSNGRLTSDDMWVIQLARQTSNMTPEQIDMLARLVLRLAERTT